MHISGRQLFCGLAVSFGKGGACGDFLEKVPHAPKNFPAKYVLWGIYSLSKLYHAYGGAAPQYSICNILI